MLKVTLVKVFVLDQEEARRFYVERLGFEVAEDRTLGDYRWLLVRVPGDGGFGINLALATTEEERALVGRQAAAQPLFALATDDCARDYRALCARGVAFDGEPLVMPWGTGATLRDLHGNRIYLNQEPA
jgi:catechol 2,3-dioxygenase-like lactoylglutathione lyase family enzyme